MTAARVMRLLSRGLAVRSKANARAVGPSSMRPGAFMQIDMII